MGGKFTAEVSSLAVYYVWNCGAGGGVLDGNRRRDIYFQSDYGPSRLLREGKRMLTFGETEKLLDEIEEKLERLKRMKVRIESTPPHVVRDDNGRLLKDYRVRDFFAKIDEEVMEFKAAVLKYYELNEMPGDYEGLPGEGRMQVSEEACDAVTAIYNTCRHLGVDDGLMLSSMHNVTVKLEKRGYLKAGAADDEPAVP